MDGVTVDNVLAEVVEAWPVTAKETGDAVPVLELEVELELELEELAAVLGLENPPIELIAPPKPLEGAGPADGTCTCPSESCDAVDAPVEETGQ